MNNVKTLTAVALALTVIVASSGGAMAAWVVKDTVVKKNPVRFPNTVNHVVKGEEVTIIGEKGSMYKIKIPGPDGWVGKSSLSFEPPLEEAEIPGWGDGWGNGNGDGGSFCINGDQAQFCISGGN